MKRELSEEEKKLAKAWEKQGRIQMREEAASVVLIMAGLVTWEQMDTKYKEMVNKIRALPDDWIEPEYYRIHFEGGTHDGFNRFHRDYCFLCRKEHGRQVSCDGSQIAASVRVGQ